MKKTYEKFWGEFGKSIKSGLVEDVPNRKRLSEISRFYTTFNDTSL
jgi:HSP90 family molecular chaperone